MTAPSITDLGRPGESLQRLRRGYHDAFTDQHGRQFAAQYDLGNQRPIGELAPVGFNPPWLPPMRFIRWERPGSFRFRWDYQSMAAELSGDTAEFYQNVAVFITDHMPHETVPEFGEPIPPKVRRILGNPPLSPALPLACEAGEPWMLGVPGAPVNAMLKALVEQSAAGNSKDALDAIKALLKKTETSAPVPTLPSEADVVVRQKTIHTFDPETITYNEFVKECKGRKMAMPDIVAAWREHRANVKAA
jgi:hypothetical protein